MKKGFTLIEIIISIALIVIVGTTTTLVFLNANTKNEEIESVTKQVLEAAKAYINVEKDEYGNTYKNGISRGGKGVQLSVQNLIDKGYLEDNQINTLERYTDLDSKELYILAAITVLDESECGENVIEYTASWYEDSEDPIYLCGYWSEPEPTISLANKIIDLYKDENGVIPLPSMNHSTLESFSNLHSYYGLWVIEDGSDMELNIYSSKESGLFDSSDGFYSRYYFRGEINNNFVVFNDELFRIVGLTEDYNIRLIKEHRVEPILRFSEAKKINEGEDAYTINGLDSYVNEWFADFSFNSLTKYSIDDINEIFVKGNFCASTKEGINNYYYNTCKNGKTIRDYSGIMSQDEVIFAGTYPPTECDLVTSPTGTTYDICVTFSYLSSGDGFVTMSNGSAGLYGADVISYYDGGFDYNSLTFPVRPIITLRNDKLEYTGGGTQSNPYIITAIKK